MMSTTSAITSSRWMKPPSVYELTRPSSHSTSRMTKIVQSIQILSVRVFSCFAHRRSVALIQERVFRWGMGGATLERFFLSQMAGADRTREREVFAVAQELLLTSRRKYDNYGQYKNSTMHLRGKSMEISRRYLQLGRFTSAIAVILTVLAFSSAKAVLFNLGEASGYAALILPGGSNNMVINGGAAVDGDVGVSDSLHLDLGSTAKVGANAGTGTIVSGHIFLNPGATVNLMPQPPNSVVTRNLSQAVTDAIAANHAAAQLTPTLNLGGLDISGSNYTIAANGNNNVISLSSFKLHGGGSLTISGSASDYFVFNITDWKS